MMPTTSASWGISQDRADEFLARGYPRRYFFPHRLYYLPTCGPDGFQLAGQMRGPSDPNQLWEVVLFAGHPVVDEFPPDLFFDDDVVWHQRQFGKVGQVAGANLVVDGPRLYSTLRISDLVQRISRRREHKTRVENRFKGWNHMLLNGIVSFAVQRGLNPVFLSTAELAIGSTDPRRRANLGTELYERIYDRQLHESFTVRKQDAWWVLDVRENRDRIVLPTRADEVTANVKTICLCHDIERGWGHLDVNPVFALAANRTSPRHLRQMLEIEAAAGVRATYSVVGLLLPAVRAAIERDGHCLAFHSYDHQPARVGRAARAVYRLLNVPRRGDDEQLRQCRHVDYRIKGYRVPRSEITPGLSDPNLCFHNFAWLASSVDSLRTQVPRLENRIVKIPVWFDDFDLHRRSVRYDEWERRALDTVRQHAFVAFGLHDCYAHLWLPRYRAFLDQLKPLGVLKTLNAVADDVILRSAA